MSVGLILGQSYWWCSKPATGSITPHLGPLDAAVRLLLRLLLLLLLLLLRCFIFFQFLILD